MLLMKAKPELGPKERPISIKRPLAFLDLETTGRTLGLDRIVEIGILKVSPDGKEAQLEVRVNPEIRIPKEATQIHGITERDLRKEPNFRKIAPRLRRFLQGCDFAGYNILNLDLPMLQSEFQRVDMPLDMQDRKVVDVMAIFVQKEPRDLKAAYRFYCGREHEQAHSAAADARACWLVLQGQLRKYPDLPNTPGQLSAFVSENKRNKTLDSGGWFETRHGEPAFARGRHQGMLIVEVAQSAPDYLEWMLSTGLPSDTIKVIDGVLPGFAK
jgi:DNA polymerase-3 subunit epsilon